MMIAQEMIAPESYVLRYKDSPYTDLIKARNELIEKMQKLEHGFLNPPDTLEAEMCLCPSPSTIYSVYFDYLIELTKLMASRSHEITGDEPWDDDDEDFDAEEDGDEV